MKNIFKMNDIVEWSSQAQGDWKTKVGAVVQVVPAGALPDRERFLSLFTGNGVGSPRKHESYVVAVRVKSAVRYYWPRVSALSKTGGTNGR